MRKPKPHALTRRERQIMDVLYQLEPGNRRASARQAPGQAELFDRARAAPRARRKGHVRHQEHGLRYVYAPAVPRDVARRSALRHLVETFFEGSSEKVVAAFTARRSLAALGRGTQSFSLRMIAKNRKEGPP